MFGIDAADAKPRLQASSTIWEFDGIVAAVKKREWITYVVIIVGKQSESRFFEKDVVIIPLRLNRSLVRFGDVYEYSVIQANVVPIVKPDKFSLRRPHHLTCKLTSMQDCNVIVTGSQTHGFHSMHTKALQNLPFGRSCSAKGSPLNYPIRDLKQRRNSAYLGLNPYHSCM